MTNAFETVLEFVERLSLQDKARLLSLLRDDLAGTSLEEDEEHQGRMKAMNDLRKAVERGEFMPLEEYLVMKSNQANRTITAPSPPANADENPSSS